MSEGVSFGANLRAARESAGLTQDVLARRLGFTRTTPISLWERSTHLPEPKTIKKLAQAVGVTPAALLANVITPYDALRGYTVVLPFDETQQLPVEQEKLSRAEWRIISSLRKLPRVLALRFATLIEESAHLVEPLAAAPDARYRRAQTDTPSAVVEADATSSRRVIRRRRVK